MLNHLKAEERGRADLGWLDSRHSFSFGHYYDPQRMGFGPLRVINDDRVAPGGGFPTHPHRDSIGTGSVIRPGDVQRMSAGTGIRHSEYNASQTDPVHFLQIWIIPERDGLKPGYEQKHFSPESKRGQLRLIGSPDGRDGSVTIHRDVDLYASLLDDGDTVTHRVASGRIAWVQVAEGRVALNGTELAAGDGVALDGTDAITLRGGKDGAEVLLFDMAA